MILRVFFLYKRDTALRQTTKYSYIRDTDIPHSILETCWKMTSVNMITKINFSVMKFTFESSFLSFLPSFTCFLSFFSSCLLFSFFFFRYIIHFKRTKLKITLITLRCLVSFQEFLDSFVMSFNNENRMINENVYLTKH